MYNTQTHLALCPRCVCGKLPYYQEEETTQQIGLHPHFLLPYPLNDTLILKTATLLLPPNSSTKCLNSSFNIFNTFIGFGTTYQLHQLLIFWRSYIGKRCLDSIASSLAFQESNRQTTSRVARLHWMPKSIQHLWTSKILQIEKHRKASAWTLFFILFHVVSLVLVQLLNHSFDSFILKANADQTILCESENNETHVRTFWNALDHLCTQFPGSFDRNLTPKRHVFGLAGPRMGPRSQGTET